MRTVLERTKPVAEAARPVAALRSEITTGMSAPPIGSTKRTPKRTASATSSHSTHWSSAPGDERDPEPDRAEEDGRVEDVLARERDRPAADQLLQLREGDRASRRTRSSRSAPTAPSTRSASSSRFAVRDVELRDRDERRRAAADPVEQGHHLRHRGHLHLAGADDADDRADRGRDRRSTPSSRSRRAAACSRSR